MKKFHQCNKISKKEKSFPINNKNFTKKLTKINQIIIKEEYLLALIKLIIKVEIVFLQTFTKRKIM